MLTIYHNPQCSKSREALLLAQQFADEHTLKLDVVDYLKTPPTLIQLQQLHQQFGGPLRTMMRVQEDEYANLNLAQANDRALLQALADHPQLLQRPIFVTRGLVLIARPPINLSTWLTDNAI